MGPRRRDGWRRCWIGAVALAAVTELGLWLAPTPAYLGSFSQSIEYAPVTARIAGVHATIALPPSHREGASASRSTGSGSRVPGGGCPRESSACHGAGLTAIVLTSFLLKAGGVFHPSFQYPDVLTQYRLASAVRVASGGLSESVALVDRLRSLPERALARPRPGSGRE